MHRVLLLVLAIVGLAYGEVIDNTKCDKGADSRNILSEVHEIRVIPCPEAETGDPCRLVRGSNATIEIDFTPTRGSRRMKNSMAWMSKVELPFRGLNNNACKFMTCPLRANTRTTYSATIALGKNLPTGTYPIKLKLNERNKVFVCQKFTIKLEDSPVDTE